MEEVVKKLLEFVFWCFLTLFFMVEGVLAMDEKNFLAVGLLFIGTLFASFKVADMWEDL